MENADINEIATKLDLETSKLLLEFLEEIKGKDIPETLKLMAEYKKRIPKDIEFTKEERAAIVEAALANFPESEQNKYKSILKMAKIV